MVAIVKGGLLGFGGASDGLFCVDGVNITDDDVGLSAEALPPQKTAELGNVMAAPATAVVAVAPAIGCKNLQLVPNLSNQHINTRKVKHQP